jgi:PAS domain S-box-containing protein
VQNLLLIGAYRDNEVDPIHPLMRKLEAMRQAGAILQDIVLTPLTCEDLGQLIADSVHSEPERITPLAQLIHEKTTGNPLFAIQFISALADEALLTFDYGEARWCWDLNRIHGKGYTDNVVDLMVGKLNRLSAETRNALQKLACLGNDAGFTMLRIVYQDSEEEMHGQLWEAVRAGLIFRSEDSYKFLHDRVQEAAYSLIPEESRAEAHLRIGRLFAAHTPSHKLAEVIFEIVNQLNRGSHLITSTEERERVAELNLIASRRARVSTAYASALKYLRAGRVLLSEESWEHSYELIFAIEYLMAECELLTANTVAAENRLSILAQRAKSGHDIAVVTRLRLTLYTTLDRSRTVEVFLEYLRLHGTNWSPHPSRDEVLREYRQIWSLVGSRPVEAILDLPLMTDPELLDVLDVFTEIVVPASVTDENLSSLIICRMVNLSLKHGNCDASCFAYVWFAIIAGPRFGIYKEGFRFGQLGYQLVETRNLTRYRARIYMSFGDIVMPWARHVRAGRDLVRRAFDVANEIGDLTYAAYSCNHLITNLLAAGDHLEEAQREAENGVEFTRRAPRFGVVTDRVTAQLVLTRTLRGLTPKFGCFNDDGFDEFQFERHFTSNLVEPECWYWIRKLQARFFAGDYATAIQASLRAQQLLWTSPSQFETAEFRFYSALSHAAAWDSALPDEKQQHFEALAVHHKQLEIWAENCPENFANRAALVGAEIARIEGRALDAMNLYEQAILSARANGFVHNEALANEIAGRFYAERGYEKIAATYLRAARACYQRWGADGKVRQLEELYPHLKVDKSIPDSTATIVTPIEQFDLATVIRVSEAVAGEIVLEKLIDTLMRTAIEHAGAGRVLLILAVGDGYRIEAEVTASNNTVTVDQRQASVTAADLPESILHYVIRTKESVLLHDAAAANPFSADRYIHQHHARSILCLPLLKQGRLAGVLYLENNLTAHVFTPDRVTVLKVLASQAAISLENSRLYEDLADREGKIRRLVDANIIGILIADREGRILEANDAFLSIVGYDRDDLVSGNVNWTELTPPEWRDRTMRSQEESMKTGVAQPYEKEYFRKDGSRVPVLVGSAAFDERRDRGVGFVLDLTQRKRAEESLRKLESDLAHINRVSMMGELAASLSHEITQPIASARNNARAAQNFLKMQPPELGEVGEALACVVGDADRAGDIIDRIREQIRKAPPRKERFDLNAAINEVIVLAESVTLRNAVSVQTKLTDGSFPVQGDRVQLQQVLMNLVLNAAEAMGSVEDGARELVISTEQDHTDALVAVRDCGPGIDPAHLDRVFDAFYTTKRSGTGMGLSICRSIIDAHGGKLWAEANEPRGAVFRFTLPASTQST